MIHARTAARSLTIAAGCLAALGASTLWTSDAEALVVHGTPLAKPAKSYVGSWNGSSAVAIGPRAVITAKHVQGYVTQRFTMDGVQYTVKAIHQHPSADIQVIELNNQLPGWHKVAGTPYPGQRTTIFGMGYVAGAGTSQGYAWSSSRAETWGLNTIDTVTSWYLVTRFDNSANSPSEAMFATFDSGGGVFVEQSGGTLALAGIAVSVSSSTGFSAFGDRGYAVNVAAQSAWLAPFTAAPCLGDLNGDGSVNSTDFSMLISSFGIPGGGGADLDGDGDCDQTDFTILTSRFGTVCPSAISASSSTTSAASSSKSKKKKPVRTPKMPGRALQ